MKFTTIPLRLGVSLLVMLFIGGCIMLDGGGTESEGLRGVFVDPQGVPAAGIWVKVYPVSEESGMTKSARSIPALDSALTNASGIFRIKRLAKGTYNVFAEEHRNGVILSAFIHDLVYRGKRVNLGTRTMVPPGSVRLTITGQGNPLEGATCRVEDGPWEEVSNVAGQCDLANLPPGSYHITVSHPAFETPLSITITMTPSSGLIKLDLNLAHTRPDTAGPYFEVTPSTVALWRFNAGTGASRITDEGPYGYHLTSNNPLPLQASPLDSAAVFDGDSRSFSVGYADRFNLGVTGKITYEARIFMSEYPSAANFKGRATLLGLYAGPALQIHSDGRLHVKSQKIQNGNSYWYDTLSSLAQIIPLNQWVTVAIAVDAETSPKQVYAYVNGTPVQLYGTATNAEFRIYEDAPFVIGLDSRDGQPFRGLVDEVRVSGDLALGPGLPIVPKPAGTVFP